MSRWKELKGPLGNFALQNGSYPGLTAGHAMNLLGDLEIENNSAYRPTGGDNDVNSGWGAASIQSIKGNARAWNQLVKNGKEVTDIVEKRYKYFYDILDGKPFPMSHKYYMTFEYSTNAEFKEGELYYGLCQRGYLYGENKSIGIVYPNQKNIRTSAVLKSNNESNKDLFITFGNIEDENTRNITFRNVMFIDLTLIYGAGNEPTTPEQFEADYQRWFGKPLEYEEYDEGSIRTVLASGLKTVGFNLSPITEFKGNLSTLHTLYAKNGNHLWKNDCGYKGAVCLSFTVDELTEGAATAFFINYKDGGSINIGTAKTGTFKLVSEEGRIVDTITLSYAQAGDVKLTNICVNFVWSGKRDGDYEPHWEEITSIPITELTSNGVKIFPDGLKRAGDVYDEIVVENGVTKAIKRIGSVDLGSLNWSKYGTVNPNSEPIYKYRFLSSYIGNKVVKDVKTISNILTSKYFTRTFDDLYYGSFDKAISSVSYTDLWSFQIVDTAFDDKDGKSLQESLQGVILYYELETPEVYTIDNFTLPLSYRIDDFGTEQVIMPEGSIAPVITTRYGVNAVDAIRRLPSRLQQLEDSLSGRINDIEKNCRCTSPEEPADVPEAESNADAPEDKEE